MARTSIRRDYNVTVSDHALGRNLPQKLGNLLWAPMLAMAVMAFPVALVLAIYRASLVAADAPANLTAGVGQIEVGAMFLGFASVFAAVAFAIARILGVLRTGGGTVQEAAGRTVQTLRMPGIAKLFILLMAMGMMLILFAVVVHVVIGIQLLNGTFDAAAIQAWSEWLEGVRRFGASTYLLSIGLGLATIFKVLGFQAVRIRELPAEARA